MSSVKEVSHTDAQSNADYQDGLWSAEFNKFVHK